MLDLYQDFFAQHSWGLPVIVGLLGLLIGSFLNVVAYRLPMMLEQAWQQDAKYIQDIVDAGHSLIQPRPLAFEQSLAQSEAPSITLSKPRSHCPKCKQHIKAWQNIPLISSMLLRGKCANKACDAKIPPRYCMVELITSILSVLVAIQFGFTLACVGALCLTWVLIALTLIDFDTQLLPDQIVLPLVWVGLILNYCNLYTSLESAVLGAIFGYMSLWTIFQTFKLLTKKEGMGFGDFKLFAALGAWLGVASLPAILMLASLIGSAYGLSMIVFGGQNSQKPIAFGPYLAIGGWLFLMYGNVINSFLPFEHYFTM